MSWMLSQKAEKLGLNHQRIRGAGGGSAAPAGGDYAMWQAACKQDWDALKAIPADPNGSHATRNRRKPALLDKYRDYLARWAYENRRGPHQNDVLVRNLIWAVDAEQWPYALNLASDCIATGQIIPWWDRDISHFVVDAVREAMEKGSKHPDIEQAGETVLTWLATDEGWAVNPFAHAKLHRVLAKRKKQADPIVALHHAKEANRLDPNCGVKGLVAELEKTVSSMEDTPSGGLEAPPPQAGGTDGDGMGDVSPVPLSADVTA